MHIKYTFCEICEKSYKTRVVKGHRICDVCFQRGRELGYGGPSDLADAWDICNIELGKFRK